MRHALRFYVMQEVSWKRIWLAKRIVIAIRVFFSYQASCYQFLHPRGIGGFVDLVGKSEPGTWKTGACNPMPVPPQTAHLKLKCQGSLKVEHRRKFHAPFLGPETFRAKPSHRCIPIPTLNAMRKSVAVRAVPALALQRLLSCVLFILISPLPSECS